MMLFKITIPLAPEGKKAPNARIVTTKALPGKPSRQFISFYTTAQTRKYEAEVKRLARLEMRGREPFEGPVSVLMDAIYPVPASWSRAKWLKAVSGVIRPTVKPDADNVSKMVGDAFNEVVWGDDAQAVDLHVRKFYGRIPAIIVTVIPTEIGLLDASPATMENAA